MRAVIAEQLRPLAAPVDNLVPDPNNARRGDVDAIRRSLAVFGQRKPIVVRRTGTDADGRPTGIVVAGNHTLQAAVALGWDHVAAVFSDDDETTAKAYALADNRTGELASWDDEQLTATLRGLAADQFELESLGWTNDELAEMLSDAQAGGGAAAEHGGEEEPCGDPPADPITRPGDVWRIGEHRIICGDCRDPDVVAQLLDGAAVNIAFTSPPYADRRTYDESSGFRPIPPAEYVEWFAPVAANVAAHLAEGGSWFVNIKEHATDGARELYVKDLVLAHVRAWSWRWVDELCWVDTMNGVPGGWPNRFKDAWEPIFHFSRASSIKFRPLANGTSSSRVFDYDATTPDAASGSGLLGTRRRASLRDGVARPSNVLHLPAQTERGIYHPAVFPIGLPAWFIRAYTDEADTVYDPFLGSGSTLVAAHRERRIGYGCEISPAYVDVACRRLQREVGVKPILAATGEPRDFADAEGGAP